MRILLVGNYPPDNQHSMQRFALMLHDGLRARGHDVRLLQPRRIIGPERNGSGLAKWAAYIDKFILFPPALRQAAAKADVIHICDHSNAIYVPVVASRPHVVTCHDLLAVRGALGDSTDCPASFTGKLLQRRILKDLRRTRHVACVSSATREDLLRLGGANLAGRSSVILLGVAPSLARKPESEADRLLAALPRDPGRPFLLNVGSNLRRKNREGALRIFKRISDQFDCDLVFAGEPLSEELKQVKREIGLNGRIIEVPSPSDALLEALYNRAFALLYPTRYEGFGWPAIEAQTCGCPVIASRSTSIPEVVGDSGLLRAPDDEPGFVNAVLSLTSESTRARLVERGFENVKRFTPERMVNQYIELYQNLCERSAN